MRRGSETSSFGGLLQEYFCERLIQQRNVSSATVASYRDTFRLLLTYTRETTRKGPSELNLSDIDAALVAGFLSHLEKARGNCPRTRNARLAAIRSFLQFAALKSPETLSSIQGVLAIPAKKFTRRVVGFLTRDEVAAVLDAPDRSTRSGRRDRAMLTTFYNTGARVSELANACAIDVSLVRSPSLRIHGKGRKERLVPLWPSTCRLLASWMRETNASGGVPLFPNRTGGRMSRAGIEDRLERAVAVAAKRCPSLRKRRISPHTLRHTTAMHMLQSGVDITVIALWLGHESTETTNMYIEADLAMKKRALNKLADPKTRVKRLVPSDSLLAFLDGL